MSAFVAKLPLTSMEVPKVPRLPRKVSLKCWKCHACHTKSRGVKYVLLRRQASADIYGGLVKVPRLPRKASLKCSKCHACHTKSRGVKYVPLRRQASADIYGGTESTTPATQSEPEVLKVSRLPHKKPRRQICPPSSPSFRGHLWRY